ncbi:hypothetical protein BaRGS_00022793 [Batillaria attramentaria]|uniref:G-protein coupled receptors family 1 profile domain-containing protein n=1 Tax=Batillaria attramentaria TaxID=370345 RepID=A0ABD0KFV2_9CAEN
MANGPKQTIVRFLLVTSLVWGGLHWQTQTVHATSHTDVASPRQAQNAALSYTDSFPATGESITTAKSQAPASSSCCDELGEANSSSAGGEDTGDQFLFLDGLLTEDDYGRVSEFVNIVAVPIMLVGIATNAISVLVYTRMPSSVTSTYFSLTSGLDILYLLTAFPTTFVGLVMGKLQAMRSVYYIYYVLYVTNYVTSTTRKVIVCVTMLTSLDRYLVVAFPIRIRALEHLRRPKLYTFIVAGLAYLFDINLAFKNKVIVGSHGDSNQTTISILPTQTLLENRQLFLDLNLTSSIIFQYTPLVMLVLFNILLVVSLARHSRAMKVRLGGGKGGDGKKRKSAELFSSEDEQWKGQETAADNTTRHEHRTSGDPADRGANAGKGPKRQRSVTRTVLVYSFVFTLLALPYTLYPLLSSLIPGFAVYGREHHLVMALSIIFLLLDVVSSAMNFFIYFATGSTFRAGVFKLLCGGRSSRFLVVSRPSSAVGTRESRTS